MPLNDLQELFVNELKDLYDAEKRISKALPKMAKAADSEELSTAFEEHLGQTEQHITRLEQIFDSLGEKPGDEKCEGMEGLLKEGKEMIEEKGEPAVKDAGLIAAAQKVEHYEMAGYGTVRTWAQVLGNEEAADLLQQTREEEEAADKKLTEIAESLNLEAGGADSSEGDKEESTKPRAHARQAASSRKTTSRR